MTRRIFCTKGPRLRTHSGFSLIEVVLALGLTSFALIGILGMFPLALSTAEDAVIETRVALIAQNIFSDLRDGAPNAATVVIGPNTVEDRETLDLSGASLPPPVFIAYTQDGAARAKITETVFNQGLGDPNAAFLAAIRFDPVSTSPTDPSMANLVRVTVQIIAPSSRGAMNRGAKTHDFVTWMSKQRIVYGNSQP